MKVIVKDLISKEVIVELSEITNFRKDEFIEYNERLYRIVSIVHCVSSFKHIDTMKLLVTKQQGGC